MNTKILVLKDNILCNNINVYKTWECLIINKIFFLENCNIDI